uniref:Putative salivary lipocalin n=1 Tax=Ixodes ricinus TaxID=34613 RepID=A0A0K8R9V4_IXORI
MKTIFRVALITSCAFASCKTEDKCNCYPEAILESTTDILDYRDAWKFLTSKEELYLLSRPSWVPADGKQCITSKLISAEFPEINRSLEYTDPFLNNDNRKRKEIKITVQQKPHSRSKSTYFTAEGLPSMGKKFPIVYSDTRCLIYQMPKPNAHGERTQCALWAKKDYKDRPLTYCKYILNFFCGINHYTQYNPAAHKDACEKLIRKA